MDKLAAMSVFVEIAEHGSLTAAAEALGRSLPTVVRVLATLEQQLGVRLFNRTTRRVVITHEGRVYLEHCRRIRLAVAESEQAMSQTHADPSGRVLVTAPVKLGEMHVAPLVVGFLSAYPKVDVRLSLLDRVVDLFEEGIDVAVRIAPLGDSGLIARQVAPIRQVICASPALVAEVGRPARPQDLERLPCVRAPSVGDIDVWDFLVSGAPQRVPIRGRLECNSVGAGITACVAGAGFGRFLCYQVMPAVRRGELEITLAEFEPPPRILALHYAPHGLGSARLRSFLDWLHQGLGTALGAVNTPGARMPTGTH